MSKYKFLQCAVLLFILASSCQGAKILFLLPLASLSHVHVFEPLIRALGEKGHEIVNLSPLKSPNMPPSVRQIQLITVEDLTGDMPNPFDQRRIGMLTLMFNSSSFDHLNNACIKTLQNPLVSDLVKNEKFDLVIVDIFLNYCVLGLIPIFEAPSILLSTVAAPSAISNSAGNRLPPSFVPCTFLKFADKMTFFERMTNAVLDSFMFFMWDYMYVQTAEKLYQKYLPNGNTLPGAYDIMGNTSMIFMNSHFTLTYPRPLLPDLIEVGGMHTKPAQKLPKDLDDFLSGSGEDGFIFFSLGSIVKAKEMPEEYRKVFINVFSRLKQRVIWKWETESMPDLPPNVKLSKWLPQQDILGHKRCKLFISHGGLLSTQETVYFGVPVLGIPIFGDQDLNILQAENRGYAKFVEILDITEEKLESAILELLNNPVYSKNVKELSKLVRDLPETPLEKAVYWTEYVLRHKGAPHLRSASRDLNFFQYYVLDVALVLLLIVTMLLYLILRCCKALCRRICGRGKQHGANSRLKKD